MRKHFAVVSLYLFVAACASPAADAQREIAQPAGEIAALVDPIVDVAAADGFGGQVSIIKDGTLAYSRAAGFADDNGAAPVRRDTLYQVASLTKYFTAVLVLGAVGEGKLDLAQDAATLFPNSDLATRDFTLDDLLSHRSGLRSTYAAESESDPANAIAAIARANAENRKDGDFHYSNDAYDLLAILLERVYGKPHEAIFREKIAGPTRLAKIGFWGEGRIEDPDYRGQPLQREGDNLRRRNYGMLGSAGLLISADDLVRFELALSRGDILAPDLLAKLRTPRTSISIGGVAYGSFLIQTPLGAAVSARGSEDWGDNAYLNDYGDCGLIIAVTTSRGPAEGSGKPLFRDQIISAIENALAPYCVRAK